jgi:hypothetical protein
VDGKQDMVAIQELNEAAPLLDLIGQFHRKFTVVSDPGMASASNQISVYVGLHSSGKTQPRNVEAFEPSARFRLTSLGGETILVDHNNLTKAAIHHAALLTIVNGRERSIYIDGTDDEAIRSLVNRLCDQTSFPAALEDSFRPGTITQAVFPAGTHAKGIIDREPIKHEIAALEFLR